MRAVAGVLAVTSVLMLSGCAQPDEGRSAVDRQPQQEPKVLGTHRGLPTGLRAEGRLARPVAAIVGPGELALATWGSSSCPWTPVRLEGNGTEALHVVLDLPGSPRRVCTADLGPTTVRVRVDPEMTRDGTVGLVLEFPHPRKEVRLVARPLPHVG